MEQEKELEGGRKHERKELERARGKGGVGRREKTPESEAVIWLLLLSSREGRKNEWEGKKEGVLINMASGCSVNPLFLSPTLYHFPHQLPTHKTLIFQTNSAEKKIQNTG